MTEYVAAGSVAPEPAAASAGVAGVPSCSVPLPPRNAFSSFSIIFCSSRMVAAACTFSNPCAADTASNVTESSSPTVA